MKTYDEGEMAPLQLARCPIACFHAFFDLLLQIGWSGDAAARLAAGHGLLAPLRRDERITVARA